MATTIQYNIKVNDQEAVTSIASLEQELDAVNQQLKQVDVNSKAFEDLSAKSQALTGQLDQVNQKVEGFTADKKFLAADGAIKALTGSVATVTGALALLGVESDKLGNFERQALGAIVLGVGLKDLAEGYRQIKESTILATAQAQIFGNVTKKALIATGIGAFVVLLGTIIAYWDDITAAISGSNNELEFQNDLLSQQIADGDVNLEILKLNLQATQLRGQSDADIVAAIKQQLLLQQAQNQQLLDNLEVQLENEYSQNRQVTLWETIKIGVAQAVGGIYGYAAALADAVNPASEKAEELQNKLNEARKRQANIDVQLAQLEATEHNKHLKRVDERKKAAEEAAAARKAELEAERAAAQEYFDVLEEIRLGAIVTEDQQRAEELAKVQQHYADLITAAILYGEEIGPLIEAQRYTENELQTKWDQIDKERAEKAKQEEIDIATAKKVGVLEVEQAKFGLLMQLGGLIDAIAGENKDAAIAAVIVQQAASIGQIIASTGIANAKSVAASPLTAGQPWVTINTISAGLSIAASIASAAKAISQIKSAGGSSSPAPRGAALPGAGASAGGPSVSPFESFTPEGVSAEETAAATTIRAYVLAGDVTSTQEANARLDARREID